MTAFEHPLFTLSKVGISISNLNKKSEKYFGLSLVQWCLLKQLIDLPASSAYELSETTGVQPSTLTQSLKRLERKKYLFITKDPNDSRKKLISITRLGKEALDKAGTRMMPLSNEFAEFSTTLNQLDSLIKSQLINKV